VKLRGALTVAFTTPLDPEDIFELSRELDRVLNGAKNIVREAEVMETAPDGALVYSITPGVVSAVAADPADAAAQHGFGLLKVRQGRLDDALLLLEESMPMRPDTRLVAATDADFAPLRDNARFKALVNE